jgi:proliferating cell nuclear antigen
MQVLELVKLRFRNARTWVYIVGSIKNIIDEGVFLATSEGLSLRALDSSRVVMVDLFYPKEAFDEYSASGDEMFGVSFDVFNNVLARGQNDESLELQASGDSLIVAFEGRGRREFKIPQISLSVEKLPEPRISFSVMAKLMNSVFIDAINSVEEVADSITISAPSDDRLHFIGMGDVEKVEVELSKDDQNLIDIRVDSHDKATYSVEYFDDMIKAARGADQVTLQYAQDAPARVQFDYEGGGRLVFYVSPRIE